MNMFAAILAVSFLPYFEAKNQVACFVFDPPAADAKPVEIVRPDLTLPDICPGCNGEGKLVLEEPDYGQASGRLGAAKKVSKSCPLCGGRGRISAYVEPAKLSFQLAEDRAKFVASHQAAGDIAVGEAFVPNAKYKELDKATLKLVEAAYGQPCRKCNWTGIEACPKCKGRSIIPCANSDCKGGWAVVKTTTETSTTSSGGNNSRSGGSGGFRSSGGSRRKTRKETKVNVQPCPTCGGTKFTICPECGGRRAHPCSKCKGLGIKTKGSN